MLLWIFDVYKLTILLKYLHRFSKQNLIHTGKDGSIMNVDNATKTVSIDTHGDHAVTQRSKGIYYGKGRI